MIVSEEKAKKELGKNRRPELSVVIRWDGNSGIPIRFHKHKRTHVQISKLKIKEQIALRIPAFM